ncbi:MAG: hypothetical protein OEW16_04715 [Gammaproteobacteria bacterium]|nr:hypothetical protein [Gammaproteobacteria bacterium]
MRLALLRLWEDDDGMLQLQLSAESGQRALSQDLYAYPEELREFGTKLEAFPSSVKDSVVFEYGTSDPKVYCWVRLRAYVYDGAGHSALEVMAQNNLEPPVQASALFSVKLEAATLNKLGQELVAWSRLKEGDFEFEAREA